MKVIPPLSRGPAYPDLRAELERVTKERAVDLRSFEDAREVITMMVESAAKSWEEERKILTKERERFKEQFGETVGALEVVCRERDEARQDAAEWKARYAQFTDADEKIMDTLVIEKERDAARAEVTALKTKQHSDLMSLAPFDPRDSWGVRYRRAIQEETREACIKAVDDAFESDEDVSAQDAIRALVLP